DQILPYRFLKVLFKSLDNWVDDADYLRCNPSFHNQERCDAALMKTTAGNIFVRLVYGFYRLRARQRKSCQFISVHSIIRGALLAPDFDKTGDYLVADIVDSDLFFRLQANFRALTRPFDVPAVTGSRTSVRFLYSLSRNHLLRCEHR
ncbi:hypothetical protein B0H13DRAFT_1586736, partial [Mycena leptocephala]